MKVHVHTKFCFICLLTFIFHHCNHCHGYVHNHKITTKENHIHSHSDYQISQKPYLQTGDAELLTSEPSSPEAEHEQRFYIEKLFNRYGENGRLSYQGLEKLLNSLGLGEVKVVEIGHDEVGHDPVSHLDVLDIQEGRHTHVHDHSSHIDAENETKHAVFTKEHNLCKENKAALPGEHKLSHSPHLHNHTYKGTNHSHNHSHHVHSGTVNQLDHGGQIEPINSTEVTREQPEKKLHKHKKKKKGTKSSEPTTDSAFVSERDEHNHVYKPEHSLEVGHLHDGENTQDFDLGQTQLLEDRQHNTRKREAPDDQISMKELAFPQTTKHHSEDMHKHDECLNVTQLLNYFGLDTESPISPNQFSSLCPALIYQIENRACIKHFTDTHVETVEKSRDAASVWLYGFFSITVISLLSLLGVILIPIIDQGCFKFLLNFLVALAVGTLSGDALLHLLPHSQGGHEHGSEESGHNHGKDQVEEKEFLVKFDGVMKGLVALGGIYLLFIVEHCLRMFKHYNDHRGVKSRSRRKPKAEESTVGRKLSDHKLNRRSDAEWLQLKPLAGTEDLAATEGQRLNETEMTYVDSLQSPVKVFVPMDDVNQHNNKDGSYDDDHHSIDDEQYENNHKKEVQSKKHNHSKHSHHSHGHCHSGKDMKNTGIASIAWMVIMGDGMHNFSDGLAIGAAFSAGLTGGISTSIAVFCHELPHELGDFAVLLKAGMTVKQAIVYNVLSAMMAYIGMFIGTAVGQYANNITLWIFAITAGMFLYVALVDMLPEMLHGDGENEEHGHCPVGQFILQNLGLLLGFAIMLVIALYEDKIVIDIDF